MEKNSLQSENNPIKTSSPAHVIILHTCTLITLFQTGIQTQIKVRNSDSRSDHFVVKGICEPRWPVSSGTFHLNTEEGVV